jgi:hypothetical protein
VLGEYCLKFAKALLIVVGDLLSQFFFLLLSLIPTAFELGDVFIQEGRWFFTLVIHHHTRILVDDHGSFVLIDDHRSIALAVNFSKNLALG